MKNVYQPPTLPIGKRELGKLNRIMNVSINTKDFYSLDFASVRLAICFSENVGGFSLDAEVDLEGALYRVKDKACFCLVNNLRIYQGQFNSEGWSVYYEADLQEKKRGFNHSLRLTFQNCLFASYNYQVESYTIDGRKFTLIRGGNFAAIPEDVSKLLEEAGFTKENYAAPIKEGILTKDQVKNGLWRTSSNLYKLFPPPQTGSVRSEGNTKVHATTGCSF